MGTLSLLLGRCPKKNTLKKARLLLKEKNRREKSLVEFYKNQLN